MRDQAQCLAAVHQMLRDDLPHTRKPRVLEAGGGSFSHIKLERPAHVTVIDISPEQLARNTYADDTILGDLEVADAIQGQFDLIVCFDVLEHLQRPGLALQHMVNALSADGLLVIGCPNRSSTKGLITRYTPHGFHVWYYKAIRGIADAGLPGHAPFETFLDPQMDFERVQHQLVKSGLSIRFAQRYEGPAAQELKVKKRLLYAAYDTPAALLRAMGRSDESIAATDWIIVAQKATHAADISAPAARQA